MRHSFDADVVGVDVSERGLHTDSQRDEGHVGSLSSILRTTSGSGLFPTGFPNLQDVGADETPTVFMSASG